MANQAMTRRTPTVPFFGRDPFFNSFNALAERFLGGDPFRSEMLPWGEEMSNRRWMPAVDIRESEGAYTIYAELPGLSKNDVNITLENNVLTLSGERRFEKESDEDSYHRIERAYGSFSRSFTLGSGVDGDNVKASFKDGVLTVTVPKREETRPRKINIG